LFSDYGEFLSSLRGCYVAAEDVGLNVNDCDMVFAKSRYMTCISASLGGSGNPSVPTADGVRAAMRAAVTQLGKGSLQGKTVAIQGLGNVAIPLIHYLLEDGVGSIIASDINESKVNAALETF
jgi:leucine dehydrogenase